MKADRLQTPAQTARATLDIFGVISGKPPKLLKLGIHAIDDAIGGVYKGTAFVIAADQGVGKSSLALYSALNSPERVGYLSMEDGPDTLGPRILAAKTGINSLDIRLGRLTDEQRARLKVAADELETDEGFVIYYAISPSMQDYLEGIRRLCEAGCTIIYADYLQKIRGYSDDRKTEVASAFTMGQGVCAEHGAAFGALSQVTGVAPYKLPRANNMRETRDIANEARVIITAANDSSSTGTLLCYLEKSTHGKQGVLFRMRRDDSGTLKEMTAGREEPDYDDGDVEPPGEDF